MPEKPNKRGNYIADNFVAVLWALNLSIAVVSLIAVFVVYTVFQGTEN